MAERNVAISLVRNFLVALDEVGGATTPFMQYAKARAEWQLAQWDEPLIEGPGQ